MEPADPELTRLKVIVYIMPTVDFYMSYYTYHTSKCFGEDINIFLHIMCLQEGESLIIFCFTLLSP